MKTSVNSSCTLNSVILDQMSMKTTMGFSSRDTHRYLNYSRWSYHLVSEVDYLLWLNVTAWQYTLALHECMLPYIRPTTGRG